jgi:excisionase family DNA binding protein
MDQSQQRLASALSSTTHYVAPAQHAPLAFSVPEACKVAGVGRTKLCEALQSGALRSRRNGTKHLILRADLESWLQSLPTATDATPMLKSRADIAVAASVATRAARAAAGKRARVRKTQLRPRLVAAE